MNVQIQISIPADAYRALVKIADRKDTQVHRLVSTLVLRALSGKTKRSPGMQFTPEIEAAIRRLNAEGKSDGAIAVELGASQPTVSRWRKRLGLVSAGRPGPKAVAR